MNYYFTGEVKTVWGVTLKRIRGINGEVGGWIERVENLDVSGNAWVSDNARVSSNARVSGNAQVCGNAQISGNALVYGNAQIYGDALVYGNAQIYGDAQVSGDARVAWLSGLRYNITVTPQNVSIGCKLYTHSELKIMTRKKAVAEGLPLRDHALFKSLIFGMIEAVTR